MQITALASSSKGNCYLISDGVSSILIEIGIPLKEIKSKVDINFTSLSGCLISHEHNDHSKYAKDLIKYCDIYASSGTLEAINIETYKYKQHTLKHGKVVEISSFKVLPFDTQHDAKEPLGFLIQSNITGKKLLFATDTYYIKPRFSGLNYIMIECNYASDIADGNNLNKVVRERLKKSHFELENVKSFLKANNLSKVKKIYLIHLSDGNSDAERFKREIMELTGIPVEVC